jgi:hypothetical protein
LVVINGCEAHRNEEIFERKNKIVDYVSEINIRPKLRVIKIIPIFVFVIDNVLKQKEPGL